MTSLLVAKPDAVSVVTEGLGSILESHGFGASRTHLVFKRELAEGSQKIEVVLATNPPYRRGTIHFLPQFTWYLPEVAATCREMIAGDERLGRTTDVAIFEQIGKMSGHKEPGDWYLSNREQMLGLSATQAAYFSRWVIPFCDKYQTAQDLIDGYRSKDDRLLAHGYEAPTIAAALANKGFIDEAEALIRSYIPYAEKNHLSYDGVLSHLARIRSSSS